MCTRAKRTSRKVLCRGSFNARTAHKSQSSLSWKFQRAQKRTSRKVLCRGSFNAHKVLLSWSFQRARRPRRRARSHPHSTALLHRAPPTHQPATPWPRPRRRARGRATSGADASPTRGCDGPYTRARAWRAERANWRESTLRACFLARFDAELTASPPARPRRSLRRCPRSRDRRSTRPPIIAPPFIAHFFQGVEETSLEIDEETLESGG